MACEDKEGVKVKKFDGSEPPVRCRHRSCRSTLHLVCLDDFKWEVKCLKCGRFEGRVLLRKDDKPE